MGTRAVAGRGRNESVPGLEEELGKRRTHGARARGTPEDRPVWLGQGAHQKSGETAGGMYQWLCSWIITHASAF